MELNNRQCLWLPPIVCKSLKEAQHCRLSAINCTRAVRIQSSTCTNRMLLAALDWKPEDSGTTQKEDVKKTTSQNATINIVCGLYNFFLQMTMANSVKVEKKKLNTSGYSVKLPVRV